MSESQKEVSRKKYPPKVDYTTALLGMIRTSVVDTTFHALMALLLITGLIIDLLGPWLAQWLPLVRSVAHGYVGAVFVFVFVIYLIKIGVSKKMRTVFTATNYVDLIFYMILVVTGISIAAANWPWTDVFPWLSTTLRPLVIYAPAIHVAITYIWIVFSTILPGGFLHGLASVYLISHLKRRFKTTR